jgi:acetoin utilization deacetylase AcuC-like enzyme
MATHQRIYCVHSGSSAYSHGDLITACFDVSDRYTAILTAVQRSGRFEVVEAEDHGPAPILALHSGELYNFLAFASHKMEVEGIPRLAIDTFTIGEMASPSFVGQLRALLRDHMPPAETVRPGSLKAEDTAALREQTGLRALGGAFLCDSTTALGPNLFRAAYEAVQCALQAADLAREGHRAFALCRPPGHHAYHNMAGGFCYFNNAAIAAQYLRSFPGTQRVTVLDVDYHHGNGTQALFYDRADVQYISLHADPIYAYPYLVGRADETGRGGPRLWLPFCPCAAQRRCRVPRHPPPCR